MSITRFTGVSGPGDSRELVEHVTMTDDVGKLVAHAIYKAWQSDERWLRLDLATVAKGNPLAFFWAEIAASAALAANSRSPWQPGGTAPRDGTYVMVFNSLGNAHIARYGMRYLGDPGEPAWVYEGKYVGGHVTHWMPLPAKPGVNE